MKAAISQSRTLIAATLGIALFGCGDSSNDTNGGDSVVPAAGSDGVTTGGSVATGGSGGGATGGALGGMGSGGLGVGGAATGGATGSGGIMASGGSTGGVGQSGGQPGSGGQIGFGGQAGQGLGGLAQLGGAPSNGGQITSGGQAGGTQAGGAADVGGQSNLGGQAGQETGGAGQAGSTTALGGRAGAAGQAGQQTGGTGETGGETGVGGQSEGGRSISFGTLLAPQAVMTAAQQLAESLSDPSSANWRATGDQQRSYHFAEAGADEPYRIVVPDDWDGQSDLPLAMFLHGSGSDQNSYLDQNGQQMVSLAREHGYLLVSPLGAEGAYGNFLRLTAPFGDEAAAAELMSQVTDQSERTNELSEQDVINVLELVLHEYPVDRTSLFLFGHSMGSGGTWYIGGKYATYWRGIAPMSGPFVQETGYPWDDVRALSIFVTEGTQTPSLDASHLLRDWLDENGFDAEYLEVDADHGGMIQPVLPNIFDFFDGCRAG